MDASQRPVKKIEADIIAEDAEPAVDVRADNATQAQGDGGLGVFASAAAGAVKEAKPFDAAHASPGSPHGEGGSVQASSLFGATGAGATMAWAGLGAGPLNASDLFRNQTLQKENVPMAFKLPFASPFVSPGGARADEAALEGAREAGSEAGKPSVSSSNPFLMPAAKGVGALFSDLREGEAGRAGGVATGSTGPSASLVDRTVPLTVMILL